jgi:hypothetical protein
MSNMNFNDNIICKYISSIIIWSLFFYIKLHFQVILSFVSSCLNNLTKYTGFKMYSVFSLKDKDPCHFEHACRYINGFLSYSLCYRVMIWYMNLNQIIKTHIKINFLIKK